eukprot:14631971-Alexandrium_andersonii.AAC.1
MPTYAGCFPGPIVRGHHLALWGWLCARAGLDSGAIVLTGRSLFVCSVVRLWVRAVMMIGDNPLGYPPVDTRARL